MPSRIQFSARSKPSSSGSSASIYETATSGYLLAAKTACENLGRGTGGRWPLEARALSAVSAATNPFTNRGPHVQAEPMYKAGRYRWRSLQPCLFAIASPALAAALDQRPSVYSRW